MATALVTVEFSDPVDKYCDAESVSFGAQIGPEAGGAGRQASVSDCTFTKATDSLTAKLSDLCANGTHIRMVWIRFYKARNSGLFLVYTLKDVLISSIVFGAGIDQVSLNFGGHAVKRSEEIASD
jgi:type VI protein secretion system component Hcp